MTEVTNPGRFHFQVLSYASVASRRSSPGGNAIRTGHRTGSPPWRVNGGSPAIRAPSAALPAATCVAAKGPGWNWCTFPWGRSRGPASPSGAPLRAD